MNRGFSQLQGQAASKQWCYPELWKCSCVDVLIGRLSGRDQWQMAPDFLCLFTWLCKFFLFCFVLGCRLKHTQELYNVRSCQGKVFNLVGIQSFGFECSLNIVWNVDLLYGKKKETLTWQCPVCFIMLKVCVSSCFSAPDVMSSTETVSLVWYNGVLMGSNGNNTPFFCALWIM